MSLRIILVGLSGLDLLGGLIRLPIRGLRIRQLCILSLIIGKRRLYTKIYDHSGEVRVRRYVLGRRIVNIRYVGLERGWLMIEFSGFDVFLLFVGDWTDRADGECSHC